MVELAKEQNRYAIRGVIQRKCDEINVELDALANIHLDTPPPYSRPRFIPEPYASPPPLPPTSSSPRWWEKLLPKSLAKLESAHQQAIAHHQRQIKAWEQDKACNEKEQEQRQHLTEHDIYHDIHAMNRWLKEN